MAKAEVRVCPDVGKRNWLRFGGISGGAGNDPVKLTVQGALGFKQFLIVLQA